MDEIFPFYVDFYTDKKLDIFPINHFSFSDKEEEFKTDLIKNCGMGYYLNLNYFLNN